MNQVSPSQTVGPYLRIGLDWPDGHLVVPEGTPGAITISGTVYDGVGDVVPDGLVETWQADPDGRFNHPDDPRGALPPAVDGFRGFGRSCLDADGNWRVLTLKPGAVPTVEGIAQAPHLDVSVFARGMLNHVVTRIYFADDADAIAADPVLGAVAPGRRHTLIASPVDGGYRFDIHLQGTGEKGQDETVFFEV